MTLVTRPEYLVQDLTADQQQTLRQGNVVLAGDKGSYSVGAVVQAPRQAVWEVLTDYEQFPAFLPSVVKARIVQRTNNRTIVERCDRRKVGWIPLTVKLVTENVEVAPTRIDYRMVSGTLDSMEGSWHLSSTDLQASEAATLLVQTITATATLGPLQEYFYEVFEQGLVETLSDLRQEMERRADAW